MQRNQVRVTLADGTVHEHVAITNRAECAYERESALKKWPASENVANTYKAWWQLVKIDKVLTCTYDDFETILCDEVAPYLTEARLKAMVADESLPKFMADEIRADGLVIDEDVVVDPFPTTRTFDSALP